MGLMGMTVDSDAAWEILDGIHDPCSIQFGCPLSLAEMGLVKGVTTEGQTVKVSLQLTEPTCMFTFRIAEEIEARMSERFGPTVETKVNILGPADADEIWTEEEMRPAARARLQSWRRQRRRELGSADPKQSLKSPQRADKEPCP
jgi:metal-sulfur cluster biosynthetic enzyme